MNVNPGNSSSGNTVPDAAGMAEASVLLPLSLSIHYEVSSCLRYSEQSVTCLLRQKDTGRIVLLKSAADPLYAKSLINEKNILEIIHQQESPAALTFPKVLELQEIDHVQYYIRSYIDGKTLEEVCESGLRKPGVSRNQALNYLIQLTELLGFLHGLTPPVIHRDIKPQNVVVDPEGICHYIDLGISRLFDGTKRSDTLIMGTRITAPPEQFGYQQTDTRSDLYSLGVLLHYCITGEYEISDQSLSELDNDVARIVQKATRFDPDKRYQSARELLSDLIRARYASAAQDSAEPLRTGSGTHRKILPRIIGILLALNLIFLGIVIYKEIFSTDRALSDAGAFESERTDENAESGNPSPEASEAYIFQEPLIEQAVRQILNIPEGTVTEKDLEKISELHIMGLQIYSNDSQFWFNGNDPYAYEPDMLESGLYLQPGTISSLEDITHMPNLVSLSLQNQQISDISLLKNTTIRELGLGYNPLTDLSPLEGNPSIRYLNLSVLDISDTEVLSTLPSLRSLNINTTQLTSLKGLENCPLEELDISRVKLIDYSEIRKLPQLDNLKLSVMNQGILEQLTGLPLKTLRFSEGNGISLDDLSVFPELEDLYFRSFDQEELRSSRPELPKLKKLDLVNVKMKDFDQLSSLSELVTLYIYGVECENYRGLDALPKLRYIGCTTEQQAAIAEQFPDSGFIFQY